MGTDVLWSQRHPIPGLPPNSREPALVTIGETLHLVYTNNRVLYHTCWQEGVWTAPRRVAAGEQATLAGTADNRLHCLFSNQFVGNYEIYYTFWDGEVWSLPQNVSRTSGASTQPVIAIAPDGILHAAWTDTTPGYCVIYHATREKLFWNNAPIPNGRGNSPAIAITSAGDIYIAWQDRRSDTNHYDIFCSVLRDGTWSIPDIVSDCPNSHSLQPRLATNIQGGCHVVWQEEEDGIYQIRYADHKLSGWSLPITLSAGDVDCRLPRIVANRQGCLQALWLEGYILVHRTRSTEHDAPWLDPEMVSNCWVGVNDLSVAITPAGQLHVVLSGLAENGTRQLYHLQRQPILQYTAFVPIG